MSCHRESRVTPQNSVRSFYIYETFISLQHPKHEDASNVKSFCIVLQSQNAILVYQYTNCSSLRLDVYLFFPSQINGCFYFAGGSKAPTALLIEKIFNMERKIRLATSNNLSELSIYTPYLPRLYTSYILCPKVYAWCRPLQYIYYAVVSTM